MISPRPGSKTRPSVISKPGRMANAPGSTPRTITFVSVPSTLWKIWIVTVSPEAITAPSAVRWTPGIAVNRRWLSWA